jgi:DinB superfamily/Pentapeptide repeats (8 copies)
MTEEFEGRDLSDAVFWGVDLSRARFRDVNLTDVTITHARVVNVDVDAFVDHVTINGVDVTQYVNGRDRWYPLRAMLRPPDPDGMRAAWDALEQAWATTIERARGLTEGQRRESVGGEWSFVDTLRHLVFAMDKWFTAPILGADAFHDVGLPNTGSIDFGWPGLDRRADPTFDEVLAVRAERAARLRDFLDAVTPADLTREVDVLENGTTPVNECIYTVLEEEFEHNRYAVRDLAHFD